MRRNLDAAVVDPARGDTHRDRRPRSRGADLYGRGARVDDNVHTRTKIRKLPSPTSMQNYYDPYGAGPGTRPVDPAARRSGWLHPLRRLVRDFMLRTVAMDWMKRSASDINPTTS